MWVCQIVIGAGQLAVHLRGTLLGGDGLQRINNFMLFALLMPLLALLQNIHIRVLLVLIWFPVFDLLEHAIFIPLKGAGSGGVQQRDDVGIVIADRVQLVDPGVVRVVHVLVALITGGKAPAAVPAAVRLLPVAVAHLAALYCDAVGGDAAIGTLPVRE